MSNTTISPNMSMPVPTVGVDTGPDWANNLNACLSIIDQHNHTSGYGVPIPPAGINITSDLTFQSNQATNLKAAAFTAQSSVATLSALYVKSVDLYYRDGSNNEIRITSGAAVNATSSGITSGTATASFVGGVLVVNSASTTPANIKMGSALLGNNTAGSHYLTLAPPNAMAADYSLVLPSIPVSTKIMALDASGNMSAPYTVDGTTIEIASNIIGVKALGIGASQLAADSVTTPKILDAAVTPAKMAALTYQISSSSSTYTTSSGSLTSVTGLSSTVTTTGRPVWVGLQPDGTGSNAYVGPLASSTGGDASMTLVFRRDSSDISFAQSENQIADGGSLPAVTVKAYDAPGRFWFIDENASAGAHTYTVRVRLDAGSSLSVFNCKLVAYQL